jgi:quinoprotein relay system zinc metallohydrolase 2
MRKLDNFSSVERDKTASFLCRIVTRIEQVALYFCLLNPRSFLVSALSKRLTRRSLFALGAGAAVAAHGPRGGAAAGGIVPAFQEIAPGVFVSAGRHELFNVGNGGHISNVSFIVGNDSVAVIDTGGSAGVGRALLAAIQSVTSRPVRYVISTHMHPDHVFGNAPFRDVNSVFVGHAKLPRSLAARGDRYLTVNRNDLSPQAFEGTRIVMPTLLVETTMSLDLGGRKLLLTAYKTAHTDNDLSVLDEATSTLILGDLLFADHIPTLDGSIKGWIDVLAALKLLRVARVVPGHGPASMSWPEAMDTQQRYLDTILSDVRAALKQGRTLSETSLTAGQSEKPAWLLFDDFHARNVSTAFAELEWE